MRNSPEHLNARANYKAKKDAQYQAALDRTAAASLRTYGEQLQRLDDRLGEGLGAKKERARLQRKLKSK